MLKSVMKNKLAKTFLGILFLGIHLDGHSTEIINSMNTLRNVKTNKYDSQIEESSNKAKVELKKTLDITEIEKKKLELQDKAILDVNKSEQMRMELEMKKLELIEAQRLKNDFEKSKLEMDLEKFKIEKDSDAKKAKARARAKKKEKEMEMYKAILEN